MTGGTATATRTVHLTIKGRVQGVGFRYWTIEAARRLGLDGWVRNRTDGSVEAVAAGPAPAVEKLIQACWRGPDPARVDTVEVRDGRPPEAPGFSQKPTV